MHALLIAATLLQAGAKPDTAALAEEVRRAERAFAQTMADRDHAAFASFLAEDTIFLGRRTLRGKAEVAAAWKRFYEGAQAPFSWEPDRVEVNDAGTLAVSTGPVSTTSKLSPEMALSWLRSSSFQPGWGAPWKYQFDPLSATISP